MNVSLCGMRRLTGLEWGIFVLGVLLLIVGVAMALHPTEVTVSHQGFRVVGTGVQHVSEFGAQVYGIIAALFGSGFLWLVLSRRDK